MIDRSVSPVTFKYTPLDFPAPKTIVFGNGLKLHFIKAQKSEGVKVELIFGDANLWNEKANGLNLLTSRLILSGTPLMSASKIANKFAQLGSFINSQASFDYTIMICYCLKSNLYDTLSILNEVLTEVNFPEQEIELQQSVLTSEYKLSQQKFSSVASRAFRNLLFGNNAYGKMVTPDDWNNISTQEIRSHYLKNWRNVELIITGDIDEKEINKIEQYFTNYTSKDAWGSYQNTNDTEGQHYKLIEKANALQSSIRMGAKTLTKSHDDFFNVLMANYILGGYFGSRLMKNIREEKGLTYGIYSSIVHLQHASYFMIGSDVAAEKRQLAEEEIMKEIRQLQQEPIGDDELMMAKNHLLGSLQNDLSSTLSLSDKFKNYHLFGLDANYYHRLAASIHKITSEDIQKLSKKYIDTSQLYSCIVGA